MSAPTGINHYAYWFDLPPEPSPRMAKHVEKIRGGWRPNRRIAAEGRDACAGFYDVYQAEWYVLMLLMVGHVGGPPEYAMVAWLAEHFPEGES